MVGTKEQMPDSRWQRQKVKRAISRTADKCSQQALINSVNAAGEIIDSKLSPAPQTISTKGI
jgi:hypothetical protein